MDLLSILNEISLDGISKKQQDITKLFPTFHDRVQAVADKGGVRLDSLKPDVWKFRVHSGTEENKWYDVNFVIKDIKVQIKKHAPKKELWVKSGQRIDLRKLARAIFFDSDVEVSCSCPAAQYWGPNYQLTQDDAKYGKKEHRPPNKRNPHQYGMVCKHLQAILKVLPFYITTVAKWIKDNYSDFVKEVEQQFVDHKEEPKKTTSKKPASTKSSAKKPSSPSTSPRRKSGSSKEEIPTRPTPPSEEVSSEPDSSSRETEKEKEVLDVDVKKEKPSKSKDDKLSRNANLFKEEGEEEMPSEKPEDISSEQEETEEEELKRKLSPKANYLNREEEKDQSNESIVEGFNPEDIYTRTSKKEANKRKIFHFIQSLQSMPDYDTSCLKSEIVDLLVDPFKEDNAKMSRSIFSFIRLDNLIQLMEPYKVSQLKVGRGPNSITTYKINDFYVQLYRHYSDSVTGTIYILKKDIPKFQRFARQNLDGPIVTEAFDPEKIYSRPGKNEVYNRGRISVEAAENAISVITSCQSHEFVRDRYTPMGYTYEVEDKYSEYYPFSILTSLGGNDIDEVCDLIKSLSQNAEEFIEESHYKIVVLPSEPIHTLRHGLFRFYITVAHPNEERQIRNRINILS